VRLSAFAAERRRLSMAPEAGDRFPAGRALSSKPAGRRCCCRSTEETDGRTLDRYIDPAPHTMLAALTMQYNTVQY